MSTQNDNDITINGEMYDQLDYWFKKYPMPYDMLVNRLQEKLGLESYDITTTLMKLQSGRQIQVSQLFWNELKEALFEQLTEEEIGLVDVDSSSDSVEHTLQRSDLRKLRDFMQLYGDDANAIIQMVPTPPQELTAKRIDIWMNIAKRNVAENIVIDKAPWFALANVMDRKLKPRKRVPQ